MIAKKEVINMRISESDKHKLSRAASLSGTSLSSFIIQSAMNRANETLRNEERIKLTPRDMKKLLEVLNSAGSDENLSKAFQQYEKLFS